MRRTLADSTFVRVYATLLLALVLTFGLAMMGYLIVDQVRREYYRERLADTPMALLTSLVSDVQPAARKQWLQRQGERLDMQLSLHRQEEQAFSYFQRRRLEDGRPLVMYDDAGNAWNLWRQVPEEPLLLKVTLAQLSGQQLRGLVGTLRDWLEGMTDPREPLKALSDHQSLPIVLSSTPPEHLDPHQRGRLVDGDIALHWVAEQGSISAHARLVSPQDGSLRWLRVGPIYSFNTMPLILTLGLVLASLIVLAGAIYLIVRGVETRMARLEKAATRIAGGYLDTRVKVESSDFMGRLGMAFNGMAAQVQSLLRAQQEMIRAVSHELRTPVARIRFAAQMVEDMTDQEAVRRQLKGIDGDIEELDQLIDEILTYARLGSDNASGVSIDTDIVECRAMAQRVVEALRSLHPDINIEVAPGEEVDVVAEPRYLQRALQNLVANACRHAESRVLIRLTRDARAVRLDVEDDGPGVPESDRMDIFKPFTRLDNSRARRSGGYGLGLSIVQKVMLWHGGSVIVDESQQLGGACFSLLLPVSIQSTKDIIV